MNGIYSLLYHKKSAILRKSFMTQITPTTGVIWVICHFFGIYAWKFVHFKVLNDGLCDSEYPVQKICRKSESHFSCLASFYRVQSFTNGCHTVWLPKNTYFGLIPRHLTHKDNWPRASVGMVWVEYCGLAVTGSWNMTHIIWVIHDYS